MQRTLLRTCLMRSRTFDKYLNCFTLYFNVGINSEVSLKWLRLEKNSVISKRHNYFNREKEKFNMDEDSPAVTEGCDSCFLTTHKLEAISLENSVMVEEITRLREEVAHISEEKVAEQQHYDEEIERLRVENQALLADIHFKEQKIIELEDQLRAFTDKQKDDNVLKQTDSKENQINTILEGKEVEIPTLNITGCDEDEFFMELPTTPRSFKPPRQSIGQWSTERLKNKMSVKHLVKSLEKK